MTVEKLLFGTLIGALCGVIHLITAIIMKKTLFGIIGEICSIGGGIMFSCIGKSPFTAIIISVLFILFMVVDVNKYSANSKNIEKSINAEVLTPSSDNKADKSKSADENLNKK